MLLANCRLINRVIIMITVLHLLLVTQSVSKALSVLNQSDSLSNKVTLIKEINDLRSGQLPDPFYMIKDIDKLANSASLVTVSSPSSSLASSSVIPRSPDNEKSISRELIAKKMETLKHIQASVGELFDSIESKLSDNRIGREMFIQFRKRCSDKIDSLRLMLPRLEKKITERDNYKALIKNIRELMESRKNETESLIFDIIHTAGDLNDSIQLELSRLVETITSSRDRYQQDLRNPFNAWQIWLGLAKRLDTIGLTQVN